MFLVRILWKNCRMGEEGSKMLKFMFLLCVDRLLFILEKKLQNIRGATNEDLGVVIKRVIFQLHPSFKNSTRVVDSPPFALSEYGWGEFKIDITIFLHTDVCEKKLQLSHFLKLNPENEYGPKLSQWFLKFSEAVELFKLTAAL